MGEGESERHVGVGTRARQTDKARERRGNEEKEARETRGKKTKMVGELCLASTVKGAQAA